MNEEKLKLEIENLTKKINTMEDLIKNKPKQKTRFKWSIIALVFISVILFTAGDISGSKTTFTTGTTISATNMNSNFDALFNLVNGNIDSANLASDTASLAKVSGGVMTEAAGDISVSGDLAATGAIIAGNPSSSFGTGDIAADDDLYVGQDIEVGDCIEVADQIYVGGLLNGILQDGSIRIQDDNNNTSVYMYGGTGGTIGINNESGTQTINLDGDSSGNGRVSVNGTQVHDYAEVFELSAKKSIEPGMVVIIDKDNPGSLKISSEAYDKKVAGIISGAGGSSPGFIVGTRKDGSNDKPVALSGRVYCYVDTSYGKIETGDLLTTSPIEGYAMKAADLSKAQGAVLGKAMEPFADGKGLILVLITLQ